MKRLSAGLIALTMATAVISPAVAQADTEDGDAQTVCKINGQESDYKKAHYPEIDQTVESIATGPWVYHKYEDEVYSRNQFSKPNEVRYYTPEVFSDWVYGVQIDATEDQFGEYRRMQSTVDGAIAECLDNPVTDPTGNFTPVELDPTLPDDLPDLEDVEPDPTPGTQQPGTDDDTSSNGSSAGVLGLGVLAVIATIVAAVSGVLPLPF